MTNALGRPGLGVLLALIVAGCSAPSDAGPGGSADATTRSPHAAPSAPDSTNASASAAPTASEAAEPGPTASESTEPSADASGGVGAEVDELFVDLDECENRRDGYSLEYPDAWYTNSEIRDVPACSWFSPEFYEVGADGAVPDEIAITIEWVAGAPVFDREIVEEDEVRVGTQVARRLAIEGTRENPSAGSSYEVVVQLGPSLEEGPNLIVRTDTDMGGDFALNRAILDRMLTTMEFFGSVQ